MNLFKKRDAFQNSFSSIHYFYYTILLFLLFISICTAIIPLSPKMPAAGLDPSWALGLNHAVVQGFSFGKQIIFTLGPYAAIYTKNYHPMLDGLIVKCTVYLALNYFWCFYLLTRNATWIIAWIVVFLVLIHARDSLFLFYPLLLSVYIVSIQQQTFQTCLRIGLLTFPLGLLVIVKGSFIMSCICSMIGYFLYFMLQRNALLVAISIGSASSGLLFFWIVIGQSPSDLSAYFTTSMHLINGFTEAMSLDGNKTDIYVFIINGVMLLSILFYQNGFKDKRCLFFISILSIFLFLSFKTAFVRSFGHAYIASTSIVLSYVALILYTNREIQTSKSFVILVCLFFHSIWCCSLINSSHTSVSIYYNFISTTLNSWFGLKNRMLHSNYLKQDYELSMNFLKNQAQLPHVSGPTDIYSFQQSCLIASDNNWSPRPIFQSYSVFSSFLARKNYRFLASKDAPQHILFAVQPIDNRLPALEDGSSWPLLLRRYIPLATHHDYLLLEKSSTYNKKQVILSFLAKKEYQLGKEVKLPQNNQPLFVRLDLKPNLNGILSNLFYKIEPLTISLNLVNGSQRHYRLVANMAKAGFLISPLIESSSDFRLLYGKIEDLELKQVRAFTISQSKHIIPQWNIYYTLVLSTINNS